MILFPRVPVFLLVIPLIFHEFRRNTFPSGMCSTCSVAGLSACPGTHRNTLKTGREWRVFLDNNNENNVLRVRNTKNTQNTYNFLVQTAGRALDVA